MTMIDWRRFARLLSGVGVLLFGGLFFVTVLIHIAQPEIRDFAPAVSIWIGLGIVCYLVNRCTR